MYVLHKTGKKHEKQQDKILKVTDSCDERV